jgi:hypothetical protein
MPQVEQVNPEAVTQEPQPQAEQGQVEQVVVGIQDGLMTLMEMLDRTPGVLPEDKQKLGNVISEYQGFITQNLGAAPGESGAPQPTEQGQVPAQQGASAVQPVQ